MQTSTDKGVTGPLGRVDPSLPQVFGRYLLVQRLSRGGMGEIFLAKHGLAGFEKLAVIKKVLPHLAADKSFISRFVDEASVAIKLQHVNVAQVFEVGRVGDEYFLALEYVEGRDLRRTLAVLGQRARRFPVDIALFIGRELANGLAYAHRRTGADGASINLVHCDISPPNVLVSFEGETKVIDFGIAKSALRGTATDPKMGFGKFGYMAPEQLIRGGVVDFRTDIYAAGVVLFELLTGRRLYEPGPEPDYRALAKKVAKGEHTMPSEIDSSLALYDELVAKALRPKPDDRYKNAAEFRDAIQHCLVTVNPTISTDRLGAFMRELFADEMVAQRELHDRVAKAHLEDFQDQLTTQTTVSFALAQATQGAQAPAPPLVATPPPVPAPPRDRQHTGPTDILTIQPPPPRAATPPPRAATPPPAANELSLAEGTGALPDEAQLTSDIVPALRRSRAPVAVAAGAAVVIIVAIVFAATRGSGSDERAPAQPQVAEVKPEQKIVVEPITEPPPAPPAKVETPPPAKVETPPPPPPPVVHTAGRHKVEKKTAPPPPVEKKAAEPISKELVGKKLSAAKAEYAAFKDKNGPRFDQEWNELLSQSQFHGDDLEGLAHRIDAFRQKLRE